MKNPDLKSLNVPELKEKLAAEQEAFRRLKFGHAISPIENPMKIRHARKQIARLQTELRSKETSK